MKKIITKLFPLLVIFFCTLSVKSQNVEIGYGSSTSWPSTGTTVVNQMFNSTSITEYNITTEAGSVKSATVCGTSSVVHYELGGTAHLLEGKLTNNSASKMSKIRFKGSTNGSANSAGIVYSSVYPFDPNLVVGAESANFPASSGSWTDIDVTPPANAKSFRIYRRIYYNETTGKSQTSSSTNFVQYGGGTTIRLAYVGVWLDALAPNIVMSSGSNPASAMETLSMTPVVYTYSNVEDNANVLYDWYTDNTYTTPTTAPEGLSIAKDTEEKTVTVSGTPTTAGTYYYKIIVDEDGGNEVTGSVTVEAYETPAPVITLTSGNNYQVVKAGNAITNIVYTVQYADGASVTGLPTGLSGSYDAGTYTISGTVDGAVTPGTFNYTVTADPLTGYSGEDVTATGSVVVKSATSKAILYLTGTATPSATDTKLYPHLNNNVNYWVTVKQAAGTAPESSFYDSYDLIILNEIVSGTNVEAVALKNINKPILNLKSFVYNSGRWSWGTADNGQANNGTVTVAQPTHPIFAGITLNEGTLELLSGAAAKGVQPADVTIGGITVATAPKNASPYDHAVAIHDVPANVRGESITAKYIMVALCNDSYDKMTNDALTLFDNAINYLLTGSQFVPVYTDVENVDLSEITIEGMQIRNPNYEYIRVMDMSGRIIISSDKDIDMSSFNKGIYIIRLKSGVKKIALTK